MSVSRGFYSVLLIWAQVFDSYCGDATPPVSGGNKHEPVRHVYFLILLPPLAAKKSSGAQIYQKSGDRTNPFFYFVDGGHMQQYRK